jgi:hypothetical protein
MPVSNAPVRYLTTSNIDKTWVLSLGSVKTTGLRTKLFAPHGVSSEAFRHVLKGGDFIRVFHKELNGAYIYIYIYIYIFLCVCVCVCVCVSVCMNVCLCFTRAVLFDMSLCSNCSPRTQITPPLPHARL